MSQQVDMSGRVCVVTGATRGIGRATADGLARLGATVVLVARRKVDGENVSQEITGTTGSPTAVVAADLSSQASIRSAAEEIGARFSRVHALINNAGIITRRREVTA